MNASSPSEPEPGNETGTERGAPAAPTPETTVTGAAGILPPPPLPSAPPPPPELSEGLNKTDSSWDHARRWLAAIVVALAVGGFIYFRANDDYRSCKKTTTTNTGAITLTTTTESCDELPLTTLVPVLAVVIALMWLDIAEVELFGLGSVKRKLNEQDRRQNELEMSQLSLANQLQAHVVQTANLQQEASNILTLNMLDPLQAQRAIEQINAREEAETVSDAPPAAETSTTPGDEAERLRRQLDEHRPTLAPWLNAARRMNDSLFADAVEKGAPSGRAAEDPRLRAEDAELLSRVMHPGIPFDIPAFKSWYEENSAQINAVRHTYAMLSRMKLDSLSLAAKFAEQLVSDLERRRLIS